MKTISLSACALLSLASISSAYAEDGGPRNIISVGYGYISVHSQSPNLSSNGPAFLTPQPAGLTVANSSTIVLEYIRKLNDVWDLELAVGIPPKHDVNGTGTLTPYSPVSTIKQVSPTLLATYKFGAPTSKLRPYVGLGVNYTKFSDRSSTASGNLASGGPTRIDLTSSVGLAAHAGVRYFYDDRWSICASVATAHVTTELEAKTGSITRTTSLNLRPILFSTSLAYSF